MKQTVFIDFITHVGNDTYEFEGYFGGKNTSSIEQIAIVVGDKSYDLTPTNRVQKQEFLDLDDPIPNSTFSALVKLPSQPAAIEFIGLTGPLRVKTNRFTQLSRLLYSSKNIGDHVFFSTRHLASKPLRNRTIIAEEIKTILSILVNWRIPDVYRKVWLSTAAESMSTKHEVLKAPFVIAEAIVTIPYSIALRLAYYFTKNTYAKPIWLISDRAMAAGDNGEAFFRHVMDEQDSSRDIFFVLSSKSPDYNRLKAIGPVVHPSSWRHKLMLLHADKVISSQADVETTNPYLRQQGRVLDLMQFDFVFLQHGIIRHDLSAWLNRFNRNIWLFITSSQLEYQSILDNPYYYRPDQVLLSGLPRFDLLESQPKQKLILVPTYRNNLVRLKTNKYGVRPYDPEFKKSEYFTFYNRLMNDEKIMKAMERSGMTGELYLHPIFDSQRTDFDANKLFSVMKYPYDYKKAFREGSMLISDHSSVVFDFAYLKKPVLYAHFDVETFFDGHSYDKSDFFSDEDDGFGEVCHDYDSLVDKTIELIESGCTMSDKYRDRVDNYFYRTDKNNSERVYDAIVGRDMHGTSSSIDSTTADIVANSKVSSRGDTI